MDRMARMEELEQTPRPCKSAWRSEQEAILSFRWEYPQQVIRNCICWIHREDRSR
jgi:hypothetical protein